MSSTGIFGSAVPAGASWIASDYAAILEQVKAGQSPYTLILEIVQKLYHPSVPWSFRTQLGIANGLFAISIIVTLAGLAVRIFTSRFWLFSALDRTIILPNSSVVYGVCSLAYCALGMCIVVGSVDVSKNKDWPPWLQGARMAWVAPLFTACFAEAWATCCSWYIRKKGAFYKQSPLKTLIARTLPFLLLAAAWTPPTILFYLAAHNFNGSFRVALSINANLQQWQAEWEPSDGLQIDKLALLFQPGSDLGNALVAYSKQSRIGYGYCAGVLVLTFVIYITGAVLEISHLPSVVNQLQRQA
ncbi:hypothetical protein JCM10213_005909 [Rhodosporidiobolus nylandii]